MEMPNRPDDFETSILASVDCHDKTGVVDRDWICEAVQLIEADFQRSADTHLFKLPFNAFPGIDIYLKDESTHPTGSLKHRLARSLFLYGLCNGKIDRDTHIVEASSGSTAISEAYFSRLLGLRFTAIVPDGTSSDKIREIEHYGGSCDYAPSAVIYERAQQVACQTGGHYMDQFTMAERATDWRGNNNIAQSLFEQMSLETHPVPSWIVVGAGTGGTSATIGRFIRYRPDLCRGTRLCVADPEGSVFFDSYENPGSVPASSAPSRLEGVGRPRPEPSFVPSVVDRMIRVSDGASVATTHWVSRKLGKRVGGSTGLNVLATIKLAREMADRNETGSLVTLICDVGSRYSDTIFDETWIANEKLDLEPARNLLASLDERT